MIHNQIQHKTKNQNQNQQDSDRITHFKLEYMKKEMVFGGGGSWGGSWWCKRWWQASWW